jgi:hypothetical protein
MKLACGTDNRTQTARSSQVQNLAQGNYYSKCTHAEKSNGVYKHKAELLGDDFLAGVDRRCVARSSRSENTWKLFRPQCHTSKGTHRVTHGRMCALGSAPHNTCRPVDILVTPGDLDPLHPNNTLQRCKHGLNPNLASLAIYSGRISSYSPPHLYRGTTHWRDLPNTIQQYTLRTR